jgi:hypothetical protein
MFGFGDQPRKSPVGPPALTGLEHQDRYLRDIEIRIAALEESIVQMCFLMKQHLDRIDHNTQTLDKNMHKLAQLTLRPPKDLLGGTGQEPN